MCTLLETLQKRLGCLYLSDLHTDNFRLRAIREALNIPPGDYPPEQWQEAACYLLGRNSPSATVGELREMLAQCAAGL